MIGEWSDITGCIVNGVPTLQCIPSLIVNIITWLLTFAGIVGLFLLVFAGLKFINSGGDPKQIENARKTITYGILGILLIFLSFVIINLIGYITNVTCINFIGFKNCSNGQATNPPPNPKPKPECKDTETLTCKWVGTKVIGFCMCTPKPTPKKTCKTYGAGASECGDGKYCNADKICADLPGPGGNYTICNVWNSIDPKVCPPIQDALRGTISGKCSARPGHKVIDCIVPYACVCIYD
jgi:hypothetical protein